MFDPKVIRKDFPMFNNNVEMQGHPLVFLDNASTTFKPYCVLKEIENYYSFETSNSHRGDYDLCFKVDSKINKTRQIVADFINAEVNEIVFTSGDTASLNIIAQGYCEKFLKKDDEILITYAEHASNVLPWFELVDKIGCKIKYIPLDEKGRITLENVKKSLTSKTKVVAIAHVGNVLGYIADIKNITKLVHENGGILVCDGAQSVPHMETNVKDLDVDFLTFSGHKMCGPTGIGVLYGKHELLEKMSVVFTGGGMNSRFYKNGEVIYLPAPEKFEAGTLNIEGIYGLGAAIKYVSELGMKNIAEYEQNLRKYAIKALKTVPNIHIYNEDGETGIIAFNLEGVFAQDEATFLNSKGIACRSGNHCAKMLDNVIKEYATIRASLYFYTTKEDIDYLVEVLKQGGDFLDAYFA